MAKLSIDDVVRGIKAGAMKFGTSVAARMAARLHGIAPDEPEPYGPDGAVGSPGLANKCKACGHEDAEKWNGRCNGCGVRNESPVGYQQDQQSTTAKREDETENASPDECPRCDGTGQSADGGECERCTGSGTLENKDYDFEDKTGERMNVRANSVAEAWGVLANTLGVTVEEAKGAATLKNAYAEYKTPGLAEHKGPWKCDECGAKLATDGDVRSHKLDTGHSSYKSALKNASGIGWNVILHGKVIDTVFYDDGMDADTVKRSLISHDGYDSAIEVKKSGHKNDGEHPSEPTKGPYPDAHKIWASKNARGACDACGKEGELRTLPMRGSGTAADSWHGGSGNPDLCRKCFDQKKGPGESWGDINNSSPHYDNGWTCPECGAKGSCDFGGGMRECNSCKATWKSTEHKNADVQARGGEEAGAKGGTVTKINAEDVPCATCGQPSGLGYKPSGGAKALCEKCWDKESAAMTEKSRKNSDESCEICGKTGAAAKKAMGNAGQNPPCPKCKGRSAWQGSDATGTQYACLTDSCAHVFTKGLSNSGHLGPDSWDVADQQERADWLEGAGQDIELSRFPWTELSQDVHDALQIEKDEPKSVNNAQGECQCGHSQANHQDNGQGNDTSCLQCFDVKKCGAYSERKNGFTKRAWVRDDVRDGSWSEDKAGKPGVGRINCPCGNAPASVLGDGKDVHCPCGRTYDSRGYILKGPELENAEGDPRCEGCGKQMHGAELDECIRAGSTECAHCRGFDMTAHKLIKGFEHHNSRQAGVTRGAFRYSMENGPREDKQLRKDIEQEYYKQGNGVEINIMSIGKIYADVTAAVNGGKSLQDAMAEAIAKYRLN
jgi:hypothetical protein